MRGMSDGKLRRLARYTSRRVLDAVGLTPDDIPQDKLEWIAEQAVMRAVRRFLRRVSRRRRVGKSGGTHAPGDP